MHGDIGHENHFPASEEFRSMFSALLGESEVPEDYVDPMGDSGALSLENSTKPFRER